MIAAASAARNAAAKALNQTIDKIGGKVLSDSNVAISFTLNQSGQVQTVGVSESNSRGDPGDKFQKAISGSNILGSNGQNHAVINALKRLEIAGGDMYIKRAIDRTQARTLSALMGEIKVAEDYGRYMQNKAGRKERTPREYRSDQRTAWLELPRTDGKSLRSDMAFDLRWSKPMMQNTRPLDTSRMPL